MLDIDLSVPKVDDEPGYLPRLEAVGFRLIFRDDLGGDPHPHLTLVRIVSDIYERALLADPSHQHDASRASREERGAGPAS